MSGETGFWEDGTMQPVSRSEDVVALRLITLSSYLVASKRDNHQHRLAFHV